MACIHVEDPWVLGRVRSMMARAAARNQNVKIRRPELDNGLKEWAGQWVGPIWPNSIFFFNLMNNGLLFVNEGEWVDR